MRRFIRKSKDLLTKKGTVRSYLLYAIGEVGLVVIGILIALSVDNWNEERKDSIKEQDILIQLQKDYKANLHQLEEKIQLRNTIIHSCESVIKQIDDPNDHNKDSLIIHLGNILIDPTFDPINDNLLNSGNISLISNKQLRRLLANISSDIVEVKDIETEWQKLINEIVIPLYIDQGISRVAVSNFNSRGWFLDKTTKHRIDLDEPKVPIKLHDLLRTQKLDDILSIAILFNYSANVQSYTLRSRILEILNLTEKEITK